MYYFEFDACKFLVCVRPKHHGCIVSDQLVTVQYSAVRKPLIRPLLSAHWSNTFPAFVENLPPWSVIVGWIELVAACFSSKAKGGEVCVFEVINGEI